MSDDTLTLAATARFTISDPPCERRQVRLALGPGVATAEVQAAPSLGSSRPSAAQTPSNCARSSRIHVNCQTPESAVER